MTSTMIGDCIFTGAVSAKSFNIPPGVITPSMLSSGAPGAYFPASSRRNRFSRVYACPSASAPVTVTQPLHLVFGQTATALSFQAAAIVAATGNATVTIDIKIAGVSILTAPITLLAGQIARQVVPAVLSTTALVAGNVLEIAIVTTVGTGVLPQGIIAEFILDEDPA